MRSPDDAVQFVWLSITVGQLNQDVVVFATNLDLRQMRRSHGRGAVFVVGSMRR